MLATLQSKLIALGAVLAVCSALLGYGLVQHADAKAAEANASKYQQDYQQAQADAAADVQALAQYRAVEQKYDALVASEASQEAAGTAVVQKVHDAVKAAGAAADGPVAPVLSQTLDTLRGNP